MIARLALVLLALGLLMAIACDDSQQEVAPSPTDSPPPTASPEPTSPPLPTPPPDLDQRIDDCIKGDDAQEVASFLETCLSDRGIETVSATNAEGEIPAILLDAGSACAYIESYVLWNNGSGWQVQSLEPLLNDGGYAGTTVGWGWPYRPDGLMTEGPTARVVADGATLKLGAVIGQSGCGSGPHASYVLFSLVEGEWTLSWDGRTAFAGLIGQTSVEFPGVGLDRLDVRGTSFGRNDAMSGIFADHKLAPVRHFEQVWTRQSDGYALSQERVVPSAVSTLLEFVYRLSSGDDPAAATLVGDVSLVATAKGLGIIKDSSEPAWWVTCTGGAGSFATGPCVIETPDGRGFRFAMLENAGNWLISAIDPCTPAYSGGPCN